MIAFAANSLLCRVALAGGWIDAPSFASVRILSGAVLLGWLLRRNGGGAARAPTDWVAAASLAVYILPFTLAYLSLEAGTGALILFGAAQLTMFAAGLYQGERFTPLGWSGLAVATGGFWYLLLPGADAPALRGAALMAVAGVAWGLYSLRGRASTDPLCATARSFLLVVPWVLGLNLAAAGSVHLSTTGVLLALASGSVASALGYVVWYAALRRLPALVAATVQLSVPLIAALGGVLFLGETVTMRLLVAAAAILGGIAMLVSREPRRASDAP
jgi:drug/metabolite transporter (DMT)-like permease